MTRPITSMPARPLNKNYEPSQFESQIYRFWEENGCFDAADENEPGQESYSIMIPPPNVTGVLHMGHALTNTIQDILIRWRRMQGDNTLWLPGTDHAGIATQTQVEKFIAKTEKNSLGRPLSRHDLGREKFLQRTWKWKEEQGSQITQQLKRLGSSLDWKRERFTMDEGLSDAVREVFVQLYHENLIYRGERIIHWCTRCQTALSDLEVIPTQKQSQLWHIAYLIVDDSGNPVLNEQGVQAQIIVATTRPETLLGDVAIAVHPEDQRYTFLHGKKAVIPLLGRIIPIITDQYVDQSFGSGGLKVTPAHDFNDYEIGKRHQLPIVSVMGKDGKITSAGGPYAGMKFVDAKEQIVQHLKEQNLLIRFEPHTNQVGLCQRCDTVSEPIISKQWFVKIEPLAKPAIEAVESGKITFTPKNWEKTYFEWMYNIRDWCISRQLWWGHQIPAWYCGHCQEITVEKTTPEKCSHCHASASELRQDEDVLDTWFSSALWPFSTLGWPQQTQALKTFYPTSVLETGFDIIFFWVARMIMMGIHFMKEVPFHHVYLHAMVRDEKGEKMSKSKGNVIDPLEVINKQGADPLRFTLAIMAGQGRDIKLSLDRVEGYRAFCNKLWNAVKFLHLHMETHSEDQGFEKIQEPKQGLEKWIITHAHELSKENQWILSRLQKLIKKVNESLKNFELNVAAQDLYDFTWFELCDWFIELSKLSLKKGDDSRKETLYTLRFVLGDLLKLAHPFIPFVTEELWNSLQWKKPGKDKSILTLMLQSYPKDHQELYNDESEQTIEKVKNIIEALRNFRGENNISSKIELPLFYSPGNEISANLIQDFSIQIKNIARISQIEKISSSTIIENSSIIPLMNPSVDFKIPLQGLVNVDEEIKRVEKEIEKTSKDLILVQNKLSQQTFLERAPKELVEKEKTREKDFLQKKQDLENALKRLKQNG